MSTIQNIYAREILDSRGVPTVECWLWLDSGHFVKTSVPTGTSVGKYEAVELRDNDPNRMNGKGVLTAVNNINTIIAPQLKGQDPANQEQIDQTMITLDGTENKAELGANAILAVSQAVLKAAATANGKQLYDYISERYQLNPQKRISNIIYTVINGGAHGASNLDIQEFQIVPASHLDFAKSLELAVTIFNKLEEVLINKEAIHSVGIVGGFTPNLYNNTDAFEIIIETIKATTYTFAQDLFLGVDMAAANFYEKNKYHLRDKAQSYSSEEMAQYYAKLRKMYHAFCIEDPFAEDDTKAWKKITTDLGETTLIIGDSLLVSNLTRLQNAIAQKLCNSILVKPNQVGTITETINVIKAAKEAGWQVVVSHRSGETNDDFIADFAVGIGAEYAKLGPPNRGERVAKYNRLSEIYQTLQVGQ